MPKIAIKRAYDPPDADDGCRILVDRLWPRGLSKDAAAIDHWAKDVAPSAELRKWFGHDPARWMEFQQRYRAELAAHPERVDRIREICAGQRVTLVYAARDTEHNQAIVLKYFLTHPHRSAAKA